MAGRSEEGEISEYKPFIFDGVVSVRDSNGVTKVPVKVIRDTGANQSFVLDSVLPFSDETATGDNVLVQGIEMGCVSVPLHYVQLESPLVSGQVRIGVRSSLPVEGASVLLGNDLAGGKVPVNPLVTLVPIISAGHEDLCQSYPDVFPACAVT